MKDRQKITRIQLDSEITHDYLLIGLVSVEPDYKLSLSINRKLKISLRNVSPVDAGNGKSEHLLFSRFSDHSMVTGTTYNLISNKSGNEYLLRKPGRIDYFLQVYSPENDYDPESITSKLREIETITAVFPIDPATVKEKNLQFLIP